MIHILPLSLLTELSKQSFMPSALILITQLTTCSMRWLNRSEKAIWWSKAQLLKIGSVGGVWSHKVSSSTLKHHRSSPLHSKKKRRSRLWHVSPHFIGRFADGLCGPRRLCGGGVNTWWLYIGNCYSRTATLLPSQWFRGYAGMHSTFHIIFFHLFIQEFQVTDIFLLAISRPGSQQSANPLHESPQKSQQ